MNKILAIGGSNSSKSINKKFAAYVAHALENASVNLIDLNDFELPLYGPDIQSRIGIPEHAHQFMQTIEEADGIVLSLAEYNGLMSTAMKNLWDWASRIDMQVWQSKPIFLMATSPGGRGGKNVLKVVESLMPFMGGNVTASFSLPFFHQNFTEAGLINKDMQEALNKQIDNFNKSIIK